MSISAKGVDFSYQTGSPVLQDFTMDLRRGECILMVGRNGAGKSTFLKLLNGILKPTKGEIYINGRNTATTPTSELAGHVAVTFQNPGDQIFSPTVRKEILFGPRNLRRENAEELADRALTLFGLVSKASRHPYDLLPAERKLLTIASAVAMDTPLLAFDEPTGGLSQYEREIISNGLRQLKTDGRSFFIVTHDLDFFLPLATQVLVLSSGRVAYSAPASELVRNSHLLRKYGVTLPLTTRLLRLLEIDSKS